jgi:hypothetical protein
MDERRSERDEAVEWLVGFLNDKEGSAPAKEVIEEGKKVGFSIDMLENRKEAGGSGFHEIRPLRWCLVMDAHSIHRPVSSRSR